MTDTGLCSMACDSLRKLSAVSLWLPTSSSKSTIKLLMLSVISLKAPARLPISSSASIFALTPKLPSAIFLTTIVNRFTGPNNNCVAAITINITIKTIAATNSNALLVCATTGSRNASCGVDTIIVHGAVFRLITADENIVVPKP